MRCTVLIALAVSGPVTAAEPSRAMVTLYDIQSDVRQEGERQVSSYGLIVKQLLYPRGLAELVEPVSVRPVDPVLPIGLRLIAVSSTAAAIRCTLTANARILFGNFHTCLVDSDRDGRFESYFTATNSVPGLVSITGRVPKKLKPLAMPVAYRDIDPALYDQKLIVAIQWWGGPNLWGYKQFKVVLGGVGDAVTDLAGPGVVVKPTEFPKNMEILGSKFTALSEKDGVLSVWVEKSMPSQPFAVKSYPY